MSAADVACYAAKDLGRNRVRVYQEGDDAPERHKEIKWVSRITRACEEDRLELYYQSIVPIGPNRDSRGHYELLLRMRDEEGELVMPDRFIPAAERYNLMPTIDRWVVQRALGTVAKDIRDKSAGEPFMLAINLSGTSLNDDRFLDFVIDQFKGHRLASCTVCFEITETAAISHLNDVATFMHKLSKYGCKFSLDDFGSGLSSFTYLKNLPVDFLKIDGHFIKNVTHDPVDQSMVEAIAKVGQAMGIKCIAERVESQDVLAKLAEIGIEYAQGFYISRPKPIEEFKRTGNDRFRGKGGLQLA
jgi:EAL domain-containing protein (putative c-di-GMP-specific phosphodiesterase class I)